jgi:hypothetical protein
MAGIKVNPISSALHTMGSKEETWQASDRQRLRDRYTEIYREIEKPNKIPVH